ASGIGFAVTELLRRQGARIVVEDINPDAKEQFKDNDNVAVLIGDVSKESTAVRAVQLANERFGKLDNLINNAARIVYRPLVEMSLEDWNSILDVTSTGVFLHTREALKAMIPKRAGAIVNIGSYACFQSFPGISAYAAAKGALAQITRTA